MFLFTTVVRGQILYQFSSKAKKKVFVSFNCDDDRDYRNLLSALNANMGSEIEFEDYTPSEIDSLNVGRVKGVLTTKIRNSDYSLVVVRSTSSPYRTSAVGAQHEQRILGWLRP